MGKTTVYALTILALTGLLIAGCSSNGEESAQTAAVPAQVIDEGTYLFPNPAYANSVLEGRYVSVTVMDPSEYEYVWKRNGEVVEGESGNTLDPRHFAKGDQVSMSIRRVGGDANGAILGAATTSVFNTPPSVKGAATTMGMRGKPEVYVSVDARDVDNDYISLEYKWFVNGQWLSGESEDWIDPALVERGDRVHAEITASDGESQSIAFKSDVLVIDNHAPRISSVPSPPQSGDASFNYQITVDDMDRDQISYELVSGPDGMGVNSGGLVTWIYPAPDQRAGVHAVKIRVSDDRGAAATQEFKLRFNQAARVQ